MDARSIILLIITTRTNQQMQTEILRMPTVQSVKMHGKLKVVASMVAC